MMSKALANIRNDVVKVVTMSVVSGFLSGKNLMDQTWQMELAYTLAGFALYELVLAQHVTEARFGKHTAMVANLAKVATMLVTVRVLTVQNLEQVVDERWLMGSAMTLAGFAAYHLVTKHLVDTSKLISATDAKQIADDWVQVGTMLVVSHLLAGGNPLDRQFLQNSANTLLGFNLGSVADYTK
ncbi:hypothetical protein [Chlorella virus XW01]|nr:hypothetical protein [Chlorella virus XW01]